MTFRGVATAPLAESVAILTYHSLDRSGSVISVDPRVFDRQMRSLADRGFVAVGLARLLAAWDERATLPPRAVALTFDDGCANFLDSAAPVLRELGFGATVFAVAGYLGKDNGWPGQSPAVPRLPLLGAGDLRDAVAEGFEVGSHSLNHRRLTDLTAAELEWEVFEPKRRLEDLLGRAVTTFAYPYGAISAPALAAVRAAYRGACGVRLRTAHRSDDPHQLPRIDMFYFRGRWTSEIVGTTVGEAYLRVRALGRVLRALFGGERA